MTVLVLLSVWQRKDREAVVVIDIDKDRGQIYSVPISKYKEGMQVRDAHVGGRTIDNFFKDLKPRARTIEDFNKGVFIEPPPPKKAAKKKKAEPGEDSTPVIPISDVRAAAHNKELLKRIEQVNHNIEQLHTLVEVNMTYIKERLEIIAKDKVVRTQIDVGKRPDVSGGT